MTDPTERLAKLETWREGHEYRCAERYNDIKSDASDIKQAVNAMAVDLKSAVERIHGRIDGQDGKIGGLKIWTLSGAASILLGAFSYVVTHWGPFAK